MWRTTMASLEQLLPTLRELTHSDKLRIMQFLVLELAREEGVVLDAGTQYPLWSPYNAFEAADALLKELKSEDNHA